MLSGNEEKKARQEIINALFDKQNLIGVPTGFKELDEKVKGLRRGNLIVLGAETGFGKSMLAITLSVNVAKANENVLYIDLENGKEEIHKRFLTNWFGLDPGYYENEKNKEQAEHFLEKIEDKFDYFGLDNLTNYGYSNDPIKAVLDIIRIGGRNYQRNPRLIIVDPLQALERQIDPGKLLNEQGRIIEELKNIALKKRTTIIICHHFKKGQVPNAQMISDIEDLEETCYRVPTLESFKGSGKIVDFAQQVWGLWRKATSDDKQQRSKSMLFILKNRSGLTGKVKMYFDEDHLRFQDSPVVIDNDYSILDGKLL